MAPVFTWRHWRVLAGGYLVPMPTRLLLSILLGRLLIVGGRQSNPLRQRQASRFERHSLHIGVMSAETAERAGESNSGASTTLMRLPV